MAKADKTGHTELTVEQQNAIDLLVVGKTDLAVAEAVGKTRQTIGAWRLYHPDFQAALNKRRHEVWSVSADKLRSLLPQALEVIEQELEGGENRVKIALEIVKLAGIPMKSIGSLDADAIVAEEARSRDMAVLLRINNSTDLSHIRRDLLEKGTIE